MFGAGRRTVFGLLGRLRRRPWGRGARPDPDRTPVPATHGPRAAWPPGLAHRSTETGQTGKSCARLPYIHSTFNIVIWVVCILALVVAFAALIASRKTWEDFGKGQFVIDRDDARASTGAVERDTEIRQLLEARNARRERRGEAPIDVDQELARLTAPAVDPELREEIRQLVVARNARRIRAGKPPLDVESEIEREISALNDF